MNIKISLAILIAVVFVVLASVCYVTAKEEPISDNSVMVIQQDAYTQIYGDTIASLLEDPYYKDEKKVIVKNNESSLEIKYSPKAQILLHENNESPDVLMDLLMKSNAKVKIEFGKDNETISVIMKKNDNGYVDCPSLILAELVQRKYEKEHR